MDSIFSLLHDHCTLFPEVGTQYITVHKFQGLHFFGMSFVRLGLVIRKTGFVPLYPCTEFHSRVLQRSRDISPGTRGVSKVNWSTGVNCSTGVIASTGVNCSTGVIASTGVNCSTGVIASTGVN
jgi:hypothetical protein